MPVAHSVSLLNRNWLRIQNLCDKDSVDETSGIEYNGAIYLSPAMTLRSMMHHLPALMKIGRDVKAEDEKRPTAVEPAVEIVSSIEKDNNACQY